MSAAPPYTGDSPPSYEDAMVHACKVIDEKFKEDPERTAEAFAEALGGQAVDKHFVAEIKNLSLTITTLKTLFGKVHDGLLTFDAEKYHDETGNVTEFADKWGVIRKRFTDNLWASKELSTEIKARIKIYYEDILPMLKDGSMSDKEKFENLTYFIGEQVDATDYNEALKKDETKAQTISQEFANIPTAITGFKAEFNAYFKRAEGQLAKEVSDLHNLIGELERQLDSAKGWRTATIATTGVVAGASVAGGAALIATGVLAPIGVGCVIFGAATALAGGLIGSSMQDDIIAKQNLLNTKRDEYNKLLAKQTRMTDVIKPLVTQLNTDMDDIGSRLAALASIMEYIKTEATAARVDLQAALDGKKPKYMRKKAIPTSEKSYHRLYICVDEYSKGYDAANNDAKE